MRKHASTKVSSVQSLCIFCASRFAGELPPTALTLPSRRFLNTTSSQFQASDTGSAKTHDGASGSQWAGFDPNSPLSASEQRERARLRQMREEKSRQEEEARQAKQRQQVKTSESRTAAPPQPRRAPQGRPTLLQEGRLGNGALDRRGTNEASPARWSIRGLNLNGQGQNPVSMPNEKTSTYKQQTQQPNRHHEQKLGAPSFTTLKSDTKQGDRVLQRWGFSAVNRSPLKYGEGNALGKRDGTGEASTRAAEGSHFSQNPTGREAASGIWQHFQPRNTNQQRDNDSVGQKSASNQRLDDEWIDRRFLEHQQQRSSMGPVKRQPFTRESANHGAKSSAAGRKCGRCLEVGHSARECTGPIRSKCNLCGEPGHLSSMCPEKTQTQKRLNRRDQIETPPDTTHDLRVRDRLNDNEGPRPRFPSVPAEENPQDKPEERVLRSRKFADEAPKKIKVVRRSRDGDEDDEGAAAREERNARKAERKAERERQMAEEDAERKARREENGVPITLPPFITVATLAQTLGVRYESFISQLARLGYDDVFPGQVLNSDTSSMIAMEYNFDPTFESATEEAEKRDLFPQPELEDKSFLPMRPPVVTIMGHVDHGKTTILDYLRKSSVAAGEAGGITQHIGAFSVPLAASGKTITFLDTPGHAAFLAMRQRGANVTDIVILVVAADDSVKPQTLEAIKHAKGAGVPIIVAVNKIDKPEANIEQVKQDLARHGVEIEDYGGETQVVPVSGKTGQGMDELEEAAVTLSEILDHRAEIDGVVEGWVLEATTKDRGRVATVLVRRGTLKQGDVIVAGQTWARVKTLRNEAGRLISEIGPGMPVEVDGWRDQPVAGDEVLEATSEQKATDVVDYRIQLKEREKAMVDMDAINEARRLGREKHEKDKEIAAATRLAKKTGGQLPVQEDEVEEKSTGQIEVPFIIKADVSGSAEAVAAYILSVSSPLIMPKVLESAVGPVHESDVDLAATAGGHIIAFNLPPNEGMYGEATARDVKVLQNDIIYRVLDDVKEVLEERLPPIITQKVLGEAEISAQFEIGIGGRRKMKIAGCKVRNGVVGKGSRVRVLRGEKKVYDGILSSLKNVKKDVAEMRKGTECGMAFEEWASFEVGDMVQTYEELSEKRKL